MALRVLQCVGNPANKLSTPTREVGVTCWGYNLVCPLLGQLQIDAVPPRLGPLTQGGHRSLIKQGNACRAHYWLSKTAAETPTSNIKACRRMAASQCYRQEFASRSLLSPSSSPRHTRCKSDFLNSILSGNKKPFATWIFLSKFPGYNSTAASFKELQ